MRRADRLFQIIQILRRGQLTTAQALADELEVSSRTIYRDIADLIGSGVPVEGAAGAGYLLRDGYDLPPLMFSPTELEALVLGARIVASWADAELGRAAHDVLAKVEAVLPERLRTRLAKMPLLAPGDHAEVPRKVDLAALRRMIRDRRKVDLAYCDAAGQLTQRRVWPLGLFFYGPVWLLAAWCELRQDFRMFRVDRMAEAAFPDLTFEATPGRTLDDFSRQEARRSQSADGTRAAAAR
ncbi:MAG TPA: YafY family protein [Geminicoccaceae bacterium]|nr:YafY family protein [Geminicoccaceae bacterium]